MYSIVTVIMVFLKDTVDMWIGLLNSTTFPKRLNESAHKLMLIYLDRGDIHLKKNSHKSNLKT